MKKKGEGSLALSPPSFLYFVRAPGGDLAGKVRECASYSFASPPSNKGIPTVLMMVKNNPTTQRPFLTSAVRGSLAKKKKLTREHLATKLGVSGALQHTLKATPVS